jgi:hypothetical protein
MLQTPSVVLSLVGADGNHELNGDPALARTSIFEDVGRGVSLIVEGSSSLSSIGLQSTHKPTPSRKLAKSRNGMSGSMPDKSSDETGSHGSIISLIPGKGVGIAAAL